MADTWHVSRLKVGIGHRDDVSIIEARGDCDLITCRKLREAADNLLNTGRCKIVFDCRDMSYIDSSGFRILLDVRDKAVKKGGNIALVSLAAPVERAFKLLRLDELIITANTVEEAVEKLKPLECT